MPFSSSLPAVCSYDSNNNAEIATETNRYGLSKQVDKENSLLLNSDRVPSRREDRRVGVPAVPSYGNHHKEQSRGSTAVEDSDFSEEAYEQSKPLRKGKVDTYSAPSSEDIGRRVYHQPNHKDVPDIDTDSFYSYEDLNGLLKVLRCVKIQGSIFFSLFACGSTS